jgi:hypothetical protein
VSEGGIRPPSRFALQRIASCQFANLRVLASSLAGLPTEALGVIRDSPTSPRLRRATFAWIESEGWRREWDSFPTNRHSSTI